MQLIWRFHRTRCRKLKGLESFECKVYAWVLLNSLQLLEFSLLNLKWNVCDIVLCVITILLGEVVLNLVFMCATNSRYYDIISKKVHVYGCFTVMLSNNIWEAEFVCYNRGIIYSVTCRSKGLRPNSNKIWAKVKLTV